MAVTSTRRYWIKIVLIAVFGFFIKLPFEGNIQRARQNQKLDSTTLSITLRSKLSQNLAIALLGGFRALTADFIWLSQVHISWEDQVWYKLKEGAELCAILQPHAISFWDLGSWHMAWNASYSESANPKYPSLAYRLKLKQDWIEAGRDFLERGIQNNPNSWELNFSQARLLKDRCREPSSAIPYVLKAFEQPEAPTYVGRMVGHMYEDAGKSQEAYQWWVKLWNEDHDKHPGQLYDKIHAWGAEWEEKLNIPPSQRIFSFKKESNRLENLPRSQ